MSHSFLIGLGGSGGKIITSLYNKLLKEKGNKYKKQVTCIAIDTDQDELGKLAQLGVNQICLSGRGNVGDYYNILSNDDPSVAEWCPNTANEGVFFASSLHDGASQCRMKSRLCFATFLKNENNTLKKALEKALLPSSQTDGNPGDAPISVVVASSIAGGTGSGIFIQVALYIKKFFREHNINNVKIRGLFACPDLYTEVVSHTMHANLYANAYAVVRELNAFNLICSAETTADYGGDLDIDIELSTACEGKLFEKSEQDGKYGEKPYDTLYFIDRVNYLSQVLGGLNEYYKAMANIAYSVLYTDIKGAVDTCENNEQNAKSLAPIAVYASAGASSIVYPYNDIVHYFAARSIAESFDSVWTVIDKEWTNYCNEKNIEARARGMENYIPEEGEREKEYILAFNKYVKTNSTQRDKWSFLAPMVNRGSDADHTVVDDLFTLIEENAKKSIKEDSRISKAKENNFINDLATTQQNILDTIDSASGDDKGDVFTEVSNIDNNLEAYCKSCISFVIDMTITFSNKILCDNKDLWNSYDASEFSIIKKLLCMKNGRSDIEWIHPVAGRYLLYLFATKLKEKISVLKGSIEDTPGDDVEDFIHHLVSMNVSRQQAALSTNEENAMPNASILQKKLESFWLGGKRAAKTGVKSYFTKLSAELENAEEVFANALLYFSYSKVYERLARLIKEYEVFFDNINDFNRRAKGTVKAYETMHDDSTSTLYVCASSDIKKAMYKKVRGNINLKTGAVASTISKALFDSLRTNAAARNEEYIELGMTGLEPVGISEFFRNVLDTVAEASKKNADIISGVDKDAFQAILDEYALANPDYSNDESNYKEAGAQKRIDTFIADKLDAVSRQAAPMLIHDAEDPYSGMFDAKNAEGRVTSESRRVSTSYRFLSHSSDVAETICTLTGATNIISAEPHDTTGPVAQFYNKFPGLLPKDTKGQGIEINYVRDESIDKHTILFYSTVHCLHPYQITAFDEMKGGKYYTHYAKRISDMESVQHYSLSPHLDKRWHKNGTMPYINVSKEKDRRLDIAKAFMYALCTGKIGYYIDGGTKNIIYVDHELGRSPEKIIYKGKTVTYGTINKAMCWLADKGELIERYSAGFDEIVDLEIEKLSGNDEIRSNYKRAITVSADILNCFKNNTIFRVDLTSTKTGVANKPKELDDISLFDLAWALHTGEEKDVDKNYAELLIEALVATIKLYCKAPYNEKDINNKETGSAAYTNYLEILRHVINKFLGEYGGEIADKLKIEKNFKLVDEEGNEIAIDDEKAPEARVIMSDAVEKDSRMQWVKGSIRKCIGENLIIE